MKILDLKFAPEAFPKERIQPPKKEKALQCMHFYALRRGDQLIFSPCMDGGICHSFKW